MIDLKFEIGLYINKTEISLFQIKAEYLLFIKEINRKIFLI